MYQKPQLTLFTVSKWNHAVRRDDLTDLKVVAQHVAGHFAQVIVARFFFVFCYLIPA